jgi:hypothetical protein
MRQEQPFAPVRTIGSYCPKAAIALVSGELGSSAGVNEPVDTSLPSVAVAVHGHIAVSLAIQLESDQSPASLSEVATLVC